MEPTSPTLLDNAAPVFARTQKIQNNAARLILKRSKRDHVTPLSKELHWLPVKYRIQYKLLLWHAGDEVYYTQLLTYSSTTHSYEM